MSQKLKIYVLKYVSKEAPFFYKMQHMAHSQPRYEALLLLLNASK